MTRERGACADQLFRYIKIQPKTIDFNTRLLGIKLNRKFVVAENFAELVSKGIKAILFISFIS